MALASQPLPSMTVQFDDENTTNLKDLLFVAQTVLEQAIDLLDNDLKEDEQLTVPSKFLPGSTIGKHLRHARDHFELLLICITSPPPYVLNYDSRSRNTPMEISRKAARTALLDTIRRLQTIVPTSNWNESITLNAVTPFPQTFQTTFARELWFAGLHCVHHWSMVRVIAGEMNINVGDDCFGFAPSTLVASGAPPDPFISTVFRCYTGREHSLGKAIAKI
ncbi:hypothetical protein C8R41DRAFT_815762 [Lentinula lateritia]|uniref:DinB-like domain-containing protein n=1 Tax=Lentinula lateritia TaxID=40482 RepID=A0ABQ8VU88_9AGAR|nr:hypothetical protein C8R41DRAFT_815762 [Lentinula lateritia]